MQTKLMTQPRLVALAVVNALCACNSVWAQTPDQPDDGAIEEIQVIGRSVSYANNATDADMLKQQASLTSVLDAVSDLPGILVNEGDAFGSDDWSTSIVIRGFQVSLSEQQIGMTVDGIANGNSNYGGGAKANRYIDTENLAGIEVSQGTADIASRSNEALGGTLNFTTIDPGMEQQLVVSTTLGDYDAQKFYVRYETGQLAPDTYAWISVSTQQSSDWMDQVAENTRDHLAAKFLSTVSGVQLTGYLSYDDTHEDNYQRIYGLEQYAQEPHWDQLTSEWTGIPYQDQAYRRGWSTLRENLFAYLTADFSLGPVDVSTSVYYHDNEGRGDWVPPYIVDVTDDGAGNPNSELVSGNTVYGGSLLGQLFYVDPNGVALTPTEGCQSALTFPYGGSGPQYDPQCYEGSKVPVGSYRHTHYQKQRIGFNGDLTWYARLGEFDNTLRAGLWWEDYDRDESRDWHKIIDSATSFRFDNTPYWVQYDRTFPVDTLMYYLEDELDITVARLRLGVKKFNVDVEKHDHFAPENNLSISSDSDALLSAGVVAPLFTDGLEVFAGYAENYAAIKDVVLERDDADLRFVEPETADNIDVGVRYSSPGVNLSLTYYNIKFDNRIVFVSNGTASGIDFLEETAGGFNNVGGVESSGVEASMSVQLTDTLSVFGSLTLNESEYTQTIDSAGVPYSSLDEVPSDASLISVKGNTVIGSPDSMGVLNLDYNSGPYFAGIGAKYVSARKLDIYNQTEVDDYILTDLYVGGVIDNLAAGLDSLEIRLTVNNLLDEDYVSTIAADGFWIGAPRTAALNVRAAF